MGTYLDGHAQQADLGFCPMTLSRLVSAMGLLIVLAGCHARLQDDRGLDAMQPTYGQRYPYYAELCAASQFRKRPNTGIEIEGGGFGGHAVLYLNGVCKVKDAHYPVLQLCANAFDPDRDGVGISVNDHYQNANWIAIEGRDFFFHGVSESGAPLTKAAYDATIEEAKRRDLLEGIKFRQVYLDARPATLDEETYKYQISFGTDYALNLARDRYCAKVPLSREQMARAVEYLNVVNAPYREGRKDFTWSVVKNNCSHLYHNVLSAAGVWPIWPTDRPLFISAFSFPTPKNEFVNLVRRSNDGPLGEVEALFLDEYARATFEAHAWLATQPGALIELEQMAQPNDIYDTDVDLIFYDDPAIGRYIRRYRQILRQPRYSDITANLRYFEGVYQNIESERRPLVWHLAHGSPTVRASRESFSKFYMNYYDYIVRQRAIVHRALVRSGQE